MNGHGTTLQQTSSLIQMVNLVIWRVIIVVIIKVDVKCMGVSNVNCI